MREIRAGDLVTLRDVKYESHYSMYGQIYRCRYNRGRTIAIEPNGSLHYHSEVGKEFWTTGTHRYKLATECDLCIHACKLDKKCPLYEE